MTLLKSLPYILLLTALLYPHPSPLLAPGFENFKPGNTPAAQVQSEPKPTPDEEESAYQVFKQDALELARFEPNGFYIGSGRSPVVVTAILQALHPNRAINIPFSTRPLEINNVDDEFAEMVRRMEAGLPFEPKIPTRELLTYPLSSELTREVYSVFGRMLPSPDILGSRPLVVHDFGYSGKSAVLFARLLKDYVKVKGYPNEVKLFTYGTNIDYGGDDDSPRPEPMAEAKKAAKEAGIPMGVAEDGNLDGYANNHLKRWTEYPSYRPGLVDPATLVSRPGYSQFASKIRSLVQADSSYWKPKTGTPLCQFSNLQSP